MSTRLFQVYKQILTKINLQHIKHLLEQNQTNHEISTIL